VGPVFCVLLHYTGKILDKRVFHQVKSVDAVNGFTNACQRVMFALLIKKKQSWKTKNSWAKKTMMV
jgi:hypothetical protein